jgi:hypothetical protein
MIIKIIKNVTQKMETIDLSNYYPIFIKTK